jgi:hypothetical protein
MAEVGWNDGKFTGHAESNVLAPSQIVYFLAAFAPMNEDLKIDGHVVHWLHARPAIFPDCRKVSKGFVLQKGFYGFHIIDGEFLSPHRCIPPLRLEPDNCTERCKLGYNPNGIMNRANFSRFL